MRDNFDNDPYIQTESRILPHRHDSDAKPHDSVNHGNSVLSISKRKKQNTIFSISTSITRFYLLVIVLPTMISMLYAVAVLFPSEARHKAPFVLWTDGELKKNNTTVMLCPRDAVCSEGILQIALFSISRTTAFASYTIMGATFLSKMHFFLHWLSLTHASTFVPFASIHKIHKKTGMVYFLLAISHTVGHFLRWHIRQEIRTRTTEQVGISGLFGIFAMVFLILSMSCWAKALEKAKNNRFMRNPSMLSWVTFEWRLNSHWLAFIILAIALCVHTPRCRMITLIFFGLWILDYLYGNFFKTYRLDIVEFTPLPDDAGVQMLWRNPIGFSVQSGEYVKIKLPWLSEGGNEWHAFSTYLQEATQEGLEGVVREGKRSRRPVFIDDRVRGVLNPKKTALLLISYQNEFASPGGRLHDDVKSVMDANDMLRKSVELAETTRNTGGLVFHLPIMLDISSEDNPNQELGILKVFRNKELFVKNTWNAQIVDELIPTESDIIINKKSGLDCFAGTNLEDLLGERGIETLIIGGFLTNRRVESTMRTAYEKGYNVFTLTDGTACSSQKEQEASICGTFEMFSTPITCNEAVMALEGLIGESLFNASSVKTESISLSAAAEMEPEYHSFEEFVISALTRRQSKTSLIVEEARKNIASSYETTQVFIVPLGDWSRQVSKEIRDQPQLRSCWVRGPYTSPYHVASSFNHLILVAMGIGITPALGVISQYPGYSRSKFLIWITRSRQMLKFFAPLLKDTRISTVFYTGKEPLTADDMKIISSDGGIYVQQSRPESLPKTIESLIVMNENLSPSCSMVHRDQINSENQYSIDDIDEKKLKGWCALYCGGSIVVRDEIKQYAKRAGIGFENEFFNW